MGRDILKGANFDKKPKEECYVPGDDILANTIKSLIDHYHSASDLFSIGYQKIAFDAELSELEAIVPEGVPGQETLETFIDTLSATIPQDKLFLCAEFLSVLTQVLYNRGNNDFEIDFEKIWHPSIYPVHMCSFLTGTKKNPLKLTYKGNTAKFGMITAFCDFTLSGSATSVGEYATDSSFVVHGTPHQLGFGAKRSRFEAADMPEYLGREAKKSQFYLPTDFWKWGHCEDSQETFEKNRNQLHVLDESGITYVRTIPNAS